MYVRMKKVKVLVKNLKKYPFFGNILDIWDILDKRSLIIKYLFTNYGSYFRIFLIAQLNYTSNVHVGPYTVRT